MIIWNQKIKKTQKIITAVMNTLYKQHINIDGVADVFNDGKEQGSLLKVYDKYNRYLDLCLWIYLPSNRPINNHIDIIVGKHINCNKINMWEGDGLEVFSVDAGNVDELHNKTRDLVEEILTKNLVEHIDSPRL